MTWKSALTRTWVFWIAVAIALMILLQVLYADDSKPSPPPACPVHGSWVEQDGTCVRDPTV
jgi:hypothetical protein